MIRASVAVSFEHDQACGGVLVIEDDADIVEILTMVLKDEGYEVITARDGHQALDVLRTGTTARPCLILLDYMMPGMNGIEFRREQLRDPALATVPVVLVTAERNALLFGDEMNVAATIRKPVDLDELLSLVGRYCGHGAAVP